MSLCSSSAECLPAKGSPDLDYRVITGEVGGSCLYKEGQEGEEEREEGKRGCYVRLHCNNGQMSHDNI